MKKFFSTFLILLLLIAWVIPSYLLPLLNFFAQVNYDSKIYRYIIVIISYFCIIVFIWLEQDNLEKSHLDIVTLFLLVIFGFFRSEFGITGEIFFKLPIYIFSLILFGSIIVLWKKIPKTSLGWLIVGGLLCLLVIPLAYIESLQPVLYSYQSKYSYIIGGVRNLVLNFSFVAPFEEIAFRGLLWGQMRKWGLNEKTIFWSQAGIFWMIHIWKIGTPITFFISLPLVILLYSILVRYSRQLSPSIIVHAFVDAITPIVVQLIIRS